MADSDGNNGADKGRFLGETRIKRALRQPGPGVTAPSLGGGGSRPARAPFSQSFAQKTPVPERPDEGVDVKG